MPKHSSAIAKPLIQIIGQLQGVEGFADVETHNLRE